MFPVIVQSYFILCIFYELVWSVLKREFEISRLAMVVSVKVTALGDCALAV